jgi:hypothetical protein
MSVDLRDYKNIAVDGIVIPELKETAPSHLTSIPTYNGKPVELETPAVWCSFGFSPPNPENNISKFSLPISHKNEHANPEAKGFFDFIETVEQHVVKHAFTHQDQFFNPTKSGAPLSMEVVESKFYNNVKHGTGKTAADIKASFERYGSSMNLSMYHTGTTPETWKIDSSVVVIGPDGQRIDPNTLIGVRFAAICIVLLQKVYSVGKDKYGMMLKLRRVEIITFPTGEAEPARRIYGDTPEYLKMLEEMPLPEPTTESKKRGRPEDEAEGSAADSATPPAVYPPGAAGNAAAPPPPRGRARAHARTDSVKRKEAKGWKK